jgi:hypothetical protein
MMESMITSFITMSSTINSFSKHILKETKKDWSLETLKVTSRNSKKQNDIYLIKKSIRFNSC